MTTHSRKKVFSIAPHLPFLPTLAKALCDGDLVEGFHTHDGYLHLSRATIFVPTRRAARELRSAFLDVTGGHAAILPQIKALGDHDEDDAALQLGSANFDKVPPAIDGLARQIILAGLVEKWTQNVTQQLRDLYDNEPLITPVSSADAFWLARDLGTLLDQLHTENITQAQIMEAAQVEASQWWEITRAFLEIIFTNWPDYLNENKCVDEAIRRNAMLDAEGARLAALDNDDPVIIAGSTGSVPATTRLMKVVAKLKNGVIVLPGYDLGMPGDVGAALDRPDDIASAIGHPQFGMRKLLGALGVDASLIESPRLVEPTPQQVARAHWVSEAMRPSQTTDAWKESKGSITPDAFENVAIVHAENEHSEAMTIACAMREAIMDDAKSVALVTPDRNLARRVSVILERYGITADDSGGTPFSNTAQGRFCALVFDLCQGYADVASLLALIKHPLFALDIDGHDLKDACFWLELLALRDCHGRVELSRLGEIVADAILRKPPKDRYRQKIFQACDEAALAGAQALADRMTAAFAPLTQIQSSTGGTPLSSLVEASITVLEALANIDARADDAGLYDVENGEALRGFLGKLLRSASGLPVAPSQWGDVWRALTSTLAIKPDYGGHPRASIWGALEARLQHVDMVILGGLNEGVWPPQTVNDAFLTRGMKNQIGMEPPERRVGLAAHDFQMAMALPQVLITRSKREEAKPAVASRWIQRLETLAGVDGKAKLHANGKAYVDLARSASQPNVQIPVKRPNPQPPLDVRPTYFSVTEIETLIRDPYAVYAKKVLGLAPLEPVMAEPDMADRGSLIHSVMEDFITHRVDFTAPDALETMRALAHARFEAAGLPDDIALIWWLRIEAAFTGIRDFEIDRLGDIKQAYAELKATPVAIGDTGVRLGGRADRIDVRRDGFIDIIDYKTGSAPSGKQVRKHLAPQLTLEGAMAMRGAFEDLGTYKPGNYLYVKLDSRGKVVSTRVVDEAKDEVDATTLADVAWEKLTKLVTAFANPKHGYQSLRRPETGKSFGQDYDHLARVAEWRLAEESDD